MIPSGSSGTLSASEGITSPTTVGPVLIVAVTEVLVLSQPVIVLTQLA